MNNSQLMLILFLVRKRGLTLTEATHRLNKNKARFWESANKKLCLYIYKLDKEQRAMRHHGNAMGQKDIAASLTKETLDIVSLYTQVVAKIETYVHRGVNYNPYSDMPDPAYNYGPPSNIYHKDYYQVR